MMQQKLLIFIFVLLSNSSFTQNVDNKAVAGKFYFYWGYNRATFAVSDLHFAGPNYNFTLQKVKAFDRPSPFSVQEYFSLTKITIPQYDYRIGYQWNGHWAISVGVDHMKYVVAQNQSVLMTGTVSPAASIQYAGTYANQAVILKEDFLRFEHTNGLNLVSLDIGYQKDRFYFPKINTTLSGHVGFGVGAVIPKTDSHVFGKGQDNPFHWSGYGVSGTMGLEARFWKNIFFRAQIRAGWIGLSDILLDNDAPERARQNIQFVQYYGVLGKYFGFGAKENLQRK